MTDELNDQIKEFLQARKGELFTRKLKDNKSIVLNYSEISEFDPTLGESVLDNSKDTIELMQIECKSILKDGEYDIKDFEVFITNLPHSSKRQLKNIRAGDIEKFFAIPGIIRSARKPTTRIVSCTYECPSCGNVITVLQDGASLKEPSHCACGRKGKFREIRDRRVYRDLQLISVEEYPELQETSDSAAQRREVYIEGVLCDPTLDKMVRPGNRVIINGWIEEKPAFLRGNEKNEHTTVVDTIIKANWIELVQTDFEDIVLTPERIQEIKDVWIGRNTPEVMNMFRQSMCPSIYGYDDIKEGLILQQIGGVTKSRSDGTKVRGLIHVGIFGDPSCLVAGTKVLMADLTTKNIEEFGTKHLQSINQEIWCGITDVATTFHVYKNQPIIEIITESGKSLKGTYNQPVMTASGWKRLDKLEISSVVKVVSFPNFTYEEIVSIQALPPQDVYDVEVPIHHRFVANGIVVHNTAKTKLLESAALTAPKARLVVGSKSSKAGITASVTRDESTGSWVLEAGAMVLANNGLCCIDEINLMAAEDKSAMQEGMENMRITISKATIQATLNANTSILLAGNPKLGRFDNYDSPLSQIEIPAPLINRLDLMFITKDTPRKDNDEKMSEFILNKHENVKMEQPFPTIFVREYIAYARALEPKMSQEAKKVLKDYYLGLRGKTNTDGKSIQIAPRQLDTLVRLSEAHAKFRLSGSVTAEDAKIAIKEVNAFLTSFGLDTTTGELDVDKIMTGIPTSKRNKIQEVMSTIKEMAELSADKSVNIEDLAIKCMTKGLKEEELEEILTTLRQKSEIFEPRRGFIRVL